MVWGGALYHALLSHSDPSIETTGKSRSTRPFHIIHLTRASVMVETRKGPVTSQRVWERPVCSEPRVTIRSNPGSNVGKPGGPGGFKHPTDPCGRGCSW